jgi:hypothetical protein
LAGLDRQALATIIIATIVKARNRWPSKRLSTTKSMLQQAFGRSIAGRTIVRLPET